MWPLRPGIVPNIAALYPTAVDNAYILIVAGQSNASAEGSSGTPSGFVSDPSIKIWDGTGGTFQTYAPGTNSMGQTASTGQSGFTQWWGTEVAFAMKWRLDNPSQTLYIIKHAYGGTGLDAGSSAPLNWHPSTSSGLYSQLKTKSDNARIALTALGKTPVVVGFIWTQGETPDAGNATYANSYNSNLTTFLSSVRTDMLGATKPFIITRSPISIPAALTRTISIAQDAVAAADGNSVVVDNDTLTRVDFYHYNPASILLLGNNHYAGSTGLTWLSDVWNAATSATVTSSTFTITGLLGSLAISVSGCQYSKNAGAYTSTGGTVSNGDTVTLQATASASNDTQTSPTVTIGNAVRTWRIKTIPAVGTGLDGSESDGTQLLNTNQTNLVLSVYGQDWGYGNGGGGAGIVLNRRVGSDGALTAHELREHNVGFDSVMGWVYTPFISNSAWWSTGGKFSIYIAPGTRRYLQIVSTGSSFNKRVWQIVDVIGQTVTDSGSTSPAAGQAISTPTFSTAKYGYTKISWPIVGVDDGGFSQGSIALVASNTALRSGAASVQFDQVRNLGTDNTTALHFWRPKLTIP